MESGKNVAQTSVTVSQTALEWMSLARTTLRTSIGHGFARCIMALPTRVFSAGLARIMGKKWPQKLLPSVGPSRASKLVIAFSKQSLRFHLHVKELHSLVGFQYVWQALLT